MAADSVLIVGGGLSGLTTAFYLNEAGIDCTIIEKTKRLGGLIQTERIDGCDLEAGAESFISTKPAMAQLANDLGIGNKIIGSNDAGRRIYVARNGTLMPMPKGMAMMVPGEWGPTLRSPLLSAGAKWKLMREVYQKPKSREDDFSVGELVRDHFGEEMLEKVAEPLLVGVYGGDSASLSARSVLPRFVGFEERYGSLIKGVRQSAQQTPQQGSLFRSFEGGMQTLINALSKAVEAQTKIIHAQATRVEQTETGWRVRIGEESLSGRRLVLACPAWAAATLLGELAPAAARELAAIPYSSAILTMLVFDRAELGHPLNGFGFLVPRGEQRTVAAATWVNTKFPSRIREGLAALRGFVVREKALEMANAGPDEIAEAVRLDFERLMGITAKPRFFTVHSWPRSMPQYIVGHAARIERLREAMKPLPGIMLTGNYFDGVGMPDSIRGAQEAAKHIKQGFV